MTSEKKPYHHGDLSLTLLNAATAMIREGGVDALSMRKLADRVGVSRTAPYHHFKDKNALLCAIAEAGFHYQDQVLNELLTDDNNPDSRALFEAYVMAYIRFADENPETYDLMFGKLIWKQGSATDSLKQVSKTSFSHWLNWVEKLQHEGLLSDVHAARRVAQVSWATLHGLCRLLNDGIYVNKEDLEAMGKTAAAMLLSQKF
ncbi:MAG: TetR/AcrR family transcriptional regulator [Pontibacterium sp.]